ncbi:MAG: DUF423 domain-containing protein [Gammaproteobacteria bacterium]
MKHNVIISFGSFNAALAIAFGAFAAHGLEKHLDERSLQVFNTAADFHFWHALGLILIGILAKIDGQSNYSGIAGLMGLGILLFCGSLYILSTTGITWLGMITPLGGTAFIIAWLWLAWCTWRRDRN